MQMRRRREGTGSVALVAVLVGTLALAGCAGSDDDGAAESAASSSTSASSSSRPTPTCDPRATTTETVQYRTVAGVDPNLLSLDVYAPAAACDAPVVMWVHGGGYATGDKRNQISDKVTWAEEHGWILVSVNYRLSAPGDPSAAQYPDHFDDVAHSVAWVDEHIAEYGGDPDRVALLGHSAGADIVSNVTTDPQHLAQVGLDLDAIACAGPLDTEGFDKTAAGVQEQQQWTRALGNLPDYLTATSATRLVKPGIGIPPMIGVVRGTPQRRAIETAFLDAVRGAGIPATAIDASGLTHGDVNRLIGAPGDTVMTPPLDAFLSECFAR